MTGTPTGAAHPTATATDDARDDDPRTDLTDCTHCGMSDWDCLDGINRAYGRHCCGMCGITPVHDGTVPLAAVSA